MIANIAYDFTITPTMLYVLACWQESMFVGVMVHEASLCSEQELLKNHKTHFLAYRIKLQKLYLNILKKLFG
jgi:hypothetical protein